MPLQAVSLVGVAGAYPDRIQAKGNNSMCTYYVSSLLVARSLAAFVLLYVCYARIDRGGVGLHLPNTAVISHGHDNRSDLPHVLESIADSYIQWLSDGQQCTKGDLALIGGSYIEGLGLGAILEYFWVWYWLSRTTGRIPVVHEVPSLGPYSSCSPPSIDCYMSIPTTCELPTEQIVAGGTMRSLERLNISANLRSESRVAFLAVSEVWKGDYCYIAEGPWAGPRFKADVLSGHPLQGSQLAHAAVMWHLFAMKPKVTELVAQLKQMLGLDDGRGFAVVHARFGLIAKHEQNPQTPNRHVRALRLALHSLGGPKRVLIESDANRGMHALRQLAPDFEWIEIPRCLFRALKYHKPGAIVSDILADVSKEDQMSRDCPESEHLMDFDEASLMLATMQIMSEGWPIVGGMHSTMFRQVVAMAARYNFPPPVLDVHGGHYAAAFEATMWSYCDQFKGEVRNLMPYVPPSRE